MRIRDVEQLTGLSRKTIRFYEAKGLLSVDRSDNSYREYDEGVVEQLKLIAVLRKAGISLADIQLWQDNVISSDEMDMFMRNQTLFSMAGIWCCPTYRNMEEDFGILPFPKYDENQQEYLSPSSAIANTLGQHPQDQHQL